MASGIVRFVTSRAGLALAVLFARAVPGKPGYAVADWIGRQVAKQRHTRLVKGVRINQSIVAGGDLRPQELDERVRAVFRTIARDIYDVYHHMTNLARAADLFVIDPSFEQLVQRPAFEPPGLVVAGLHYGGFNMCLHWIARQMLKPLVLTVPDPNGPLELEYRLRRRLGMNVMPSSFNGIRQAAHYLKQGGIVLTAFDRPLPESHPQPLFFNRPSCLPTHHIHLALRTGAPVILVANRREADGKYHIYASPVIEMEHRPNRSDELLCNTEKVLLVVENFIRQAPEQWTMSRPVWPDLTR